MCVCLNVLLKYKTFTILCFRCIENDPVIHANIYIEIYIYILFQILFPYRLLQNTESGSLCYTVDPCWLSILYILGFPGGSDGKAFACNAGNPGPIPGSG